MYNQSITSLESCRANTAGCLLKEITGMTDRLEQEIARLNQIHDARERTRAKMELLLERIPKGIEEAESGNAEAAAAYLSATQKILSAALSEEENGYHRLIGKQADTDEKHEETP